MCTAEKLCHFHILLNPACALLCRAENWRVEGEAGSRTPTRAGTISSTRSRSGTYTSKTIFLT